MSLSLQRLILCILFCLIGFPAFAQDERLRSARLLVDTKQYDKALETYKKLYAETPADEDVYKDYLNLLLLQKEYKTAEKLVEQQVKITPHAPVLFIDMGRVHQAAGRDKKANEEFEGALKYINGDDILTQKMAQAFSDIGNYQYAILTYERARKILNNPYLYFSPLARLYARTNETDKAVNALLDGAPGNIGGVEDTKATMLELLGNDTKKLQIAQKAVLKRINENPGNLFFADVLVWLYTQKGDWDGALIQIEAIDERNSEHGQRILGFSRHAMREGQFETAIRALDIIIEKGNELPMYTIAKAEKLEVMMKHLEEDPFYKPEDIAALSKDYETFFAQYPQYYPTDVLLDYAKLEAQYNNNPQKGIALIEKAIAQPTASKQFIGKAKLQLGDYNILTGEIWEASLLYSQVDKSFREDMLGEEARFRNAKLAYYRGDFSWAQSQLSVLKASTSELIANDALSLSVLITENIPPDSNLVPLQRFAYADLLLFRNKDQEAAALLDSLSNAFPKHPLRDDILLLHARIAEKHRDYQKSLDYLKDIYLQFGKDVLGDDAVFRTAHIYEKYLGQKDKARHFYEQLILEYPGSTYVQVSRKRLEDLSKEGRPVVP